MIQIAATQVSNTGMVRRQWTQLDLHLAELGAAYTHGTLALRTYVKSSAEGAGTEVRAALCYPNSKHIVCEWNDRHPPAMPVERAAAMIAHRVIQYILSEEIEELDDA